MHLFIEIIMYALSGLGIRANVLAYVMRVRAAHG